MVHKKEIKRLHSASVIWSPSSDQLALAAALNIPYHTLLL